MIDFLDDATGRPVHFWNVDRRERRLDAADRARRYAYIFIVENHSILAAILVERVDGERVPASGEESAKLKNAEDDVARLGDGKKGALGLMSRNPLAAGDHLVAERRVGVFGFLETKIIAVDRADSERAERGGASRHRGGRLKPASEAAVGGYRLETKRGVGQIDFENRDTLRSRRVGDGVEVYALPNIRDDGILPVRDRRPREEHR